MVFFKKKPQQKFPDLKPQDISAIQTILRKLNTASNLSTQDWLDFTQAWGMLLFVELWLRAGSFKKLQNFFDSRSETLPEVGLIERNEIEIRTAVDHTAWIVSSAGRYHLIKMSCLRRALVLQWLLRRNGIQTQLRFGVRTQGKDLQAHAWLEKDGILVSEPELVRERYSTLKEIGQVYENGVS